jgi:hypothetical protein
MAGIGVTRPVADRGVGRREVLERSFWQIPGKGPCMVVHAYGTALVAMPAGTSRDPYGRPARW